jgi:hypothetical protein
MKSKVTLPWNAAAWRQNTYEPRVLNRSCPHCGYHVCSCKPVKLERRSRDEIAALNAAAADNAKPGEAYIFTHSDGYQTPMVRGPDLV